MVHDGRKVARVIGLTHGVFVRHLRRRNHVAAAQFNAVDARLPCSLVHQTLHVVDRFWTTCTSVSASRRGVGQHAHKVEIDQLYVVHAALHPWANQELNGHTRHRRVGTHVGKRVDPQSQNLAFCIQRHPRFDGHVAAMRTAQKVFAAVGNPFDGALQGMGGIGHHQVFRVSAGFHAKPTAHITHHHAHLRGGKPQQVTHQSAHARWHLRAHAHHQTTLFWGYQHAARLNRQSYQALVGDVELHHMCRLSKGLGCGSRIAITCFGYTVVGRITQQRCICFQCVIEGHRTRQLFKFHHHGFSGNACLLFRICHHGGHSLAHVAHAVSRQNASIGRCGGCAICTGEIHGPGHGFHACVFELRARHHQVHARHGLGRRGVNRHNACVRIRRTHKAQTGLTVWRDVVGIDASALEQLRVFQTLNSLSAAKF